jgi:hypothetical protein
MEDAAYAGKCRAILARGQKKLVAELFDGDYFINRVDPAHLDAINSGTGCEIDQVFKDFLLSRIIETRGTRSSEITSTSDADWNEQVVLEIGPHPDLSDPQKKVIALDYGMSEGKAQISVRRALLYYAIKRLGLDSEPGARRPQEQQIVLLNGSELGTKTRAQTSMSQIEG